MKVITLARKPLGTSVAECAVEWGTGSVNIKASRIGYKDDTDREANLYRPGRGDQTGNRLPDFPHHSRDWGAWTGGRGRWPANMILQHKPGCRQVGAEIAPDEKVAVWEWECEKDCGAADLGKVEARSAGLYPSVDYVGKRSNVFGKGLENTQGPLYADRGGASRFFKQVKP